MDKSRKEKDYTIYQLIYEDPLISCVTLAEKTAIPKRKVQKYLTEMYEKSILKGPLLSVKPARNYHEYAYFVNVVNPLDVYKGLKGVVYGNVSCGSWNLLVITGD
ncbi:MAG: winged helix-turn-helix domain-containing protein [Theionarchaea archaeon]|nr:winged helix-turn-helix domain-containing protein [Theionarchaea archaeon]